MEGGSESYTVIRESNQIGSAHGMPQDLSPGQGHMSPRAMGHLRPLFSESKPISED